MRRRTFLATAAASAIPLLPSKKADAQPLRTPAAASPAIVPPRRVLTPEEIEDRRLERWRERGKERIEKFFNPRAVQFLALLAQELESVEHYYGDVKNFDGIGGPWEENYYDDDLRWGLYLTIGPRTDPDLPLFGHQGSELSGHDVDIAVRALFSDNHGDDCEEPGCPGKLGVAFAIDITTVDGECLGHLCPGNYSSGLWVPWNDPEKLRERWYYTTGVESAPGHDLVHGEAASSSRPVSTAGTSLGVASPWVLDSFVDTLVEHRAEVEAKYTAKKL